MYINGFLVHASLFSETQSGLEFKSLRCSRSYEISAPEHPNPSHNVFCNGLYGEHLCKQQHTLWTLFVHQTTKRHNATIVTRNSNHEVAGEEEPTQSQTVDYTYGKDLSHTIRRETVLEPIFNCRISPNLVEMTLKSRRSKIPENCQIPENPQSPKSPNA